MYCIILPTAKVFFIFVSIQKPTNTLHLSTNSIHETYLFYFSYIFYFIVSLFFHWKINTYLSETSLWGIILTYHFIVQFKKLFSGVVNSHSVKKISKKKSKITLHVCSPIIKFICHLGKSSDDADIGDEETPVNFEQKGEETSVA